MTAGFVLTARQSQPDLLYLEAKLHMPGLETCTALEIAPRQLEEWVAVATSFADSDDGTNCEIGAGAIGVHSSGFRIALSRSGLIILVQVTVRDMCVQFGKVECCMTASGYFVTELVLIDNFRFELSQLVANRCGKAELGEAGTFASSDLV